MFSVKFKKVKMKEIHSRVCGKYRKCKSPEILCNFLKNLGLSLFTVSATMKIKRYLKSNDQLRC